MPRGLCDEISWERWHSKGHHVHRGNWELPPRPVPLHCLEQPLPPPSTSHSSTCTPVPAALLAPLASLGKKHVWFPPSLYPIAQPQQPDCSLQGPWLLCQLGLFLAKSLHRQGQLRTAAKLVFFLLALTLLPLLPLLRVNGKQNVCVFQDFSSAPFFPLPFGTMLLIAPNRPDHLTTTIPHSKCMTHYRLFLLPTAYHKR